MSFFDVLIGLIRGCLDFCFDVICLRGWGEVFLWKGGVEGREVSEGSGICGGWPRLRCNVHGEEYSRSGVLILG